MEHVNLYNFLQTFIFVWCAYFVVKKDYKGV